MIWNSMRFVFVLLILCGLVACAGFGTQAEPTPAPVPSSTSTPLPTNTPRPTNTPLPTDTPAPTPTPTPTETETPVVEDTVIQVTDTAVLEKGVMRNHTTFTESEDGITMHWIIPPESQHHSENQEVGQEFEFTYDAIEDNNLFTRTGEQFETTFEEQVSLQGNQRPLVYMSAPDGTHLAYWNYDIGEKGAWENICEVQTDDKGNPLINLDQKEIDPQLEQHIGYLGQQEERVNPQEWGITDPEAEAWFRYFGIMAKPHSLVSEKIFFGGEVTKTVHWFNMKMGDTMISTIAFDDAGVPLEVTSRVVEKGVDDAEFFATNAMTQFGVDADAAGEFKTLEEIIKLVADTKLVLFKGSVSSPSLVKKWSTTYNNLGDSPPMAFTVGAGKRIASIHLPSWLEKYPNNGQQEFITGLFEGDHTTDVDRVIVAHDLMIMLTEN